MPTEFLASDFFARQGLARGVVVSFHYCIAGDTHPFRRISANWCIENQVGRFRHRCAGFGACVGAQCNPWLCQPCHWMTHAELGLPQEQIDHPAAAHMVARLTTVGEEVGVVAAGVFEGIGEDRKTIERPFIVDRLCQGGNRAVVP